MTKKITKLISILSLLALLLLLGTFGVSAVTNDDTVGVSSYAFGKISLDGTFRLPSPSAEVSKVSPSGNYSDLKLYVGGMPFGVKFLTAGVHVIGFNDSALENQENPARAAGLKCNDLIISINGRKLTSAAELNEIISGCQGKPLDVKYSRDGKEYSTTVTPKFSKTEQRYCTGLYVRDSGAGIGTVTFIHPKTCAFGGLGHGICDGDTGRLIPMQRGSVVGVKINGIVKGLSGSPGEVKGYFNSGKSGTLLGNTDCGVYGVLAELPREIQGEPMSLGLRDSVKNGKAHLYAMLDGNKVEKYEVEISDIDRQSTGNKCFVVKITDKRLISKTGGIIQGMSGSPIIQNGKLVGAVTHVLINDPTTGYGIFIENMLNQMGDLAG